MRCSDCSKVVKPIVAIDIDGTLGDYHSHFIAYARTYMGLASGTRHGLYDGTEHFREWCCRTMHIDVAEFRKIKLAYRQGGLKRSMPLYDGAYELVSGLTEAGAEIWLTTTRPYLRLDNVDPDTRFWLERHQITCAGMLYDEDKYKLLAERVDPERVVAVLDDLPEQYDAAKHEFGSHVPMLRRNPYNRAVQRPRAAESLHAAATVIKTSMEDWRRQHGS